VTAIVGYGFPPFNCLISRAFASALHVIFNRLDELRAYVDKVQIPAAVSELKLCSSCIVIFFEQNRLPDDLPYCFLVLLRCRRALVRYFSRCSFHFC